MPAKPCPGVPHPHVFGTPSRDGDSTTALGSLFQCLTALSELFVQYLATYSYKHGRGKEKNALTYSDLSHTAEECETFQFLADILPKKILASKYLKMLEKEKRDGEVREDDEEDEEEEDEDETVDEDVGS
ncbi:chromatin accessibility complex protein 1 isoform X2 [Opisthocomus hoazin]|uniref:chromatin accessibility complex protein 1 isoform X2 n=1 Tax=Opisthocomus hoazin TaxID=30419 RepID=UPI003F53AAED